MRPLLTVVVVVVFALTFAGTLAADRFAVFQLGDIKGELNAGAMKEWMGCAAFEHNVPGLASPAQLMVGNMPGDPDGEYRPNANYQGFQVTKEVDRATAKLMRACARAQRFPEMKLALCSRAGGETTREALFTLTDVRITSMTLMAPGHGDRPAGVAEDKALVTITVTCTVMGLNFEEIKWT